MTRSWWQGIGRWVISPRRQPTAIALSVFAGAAFLMWTAGWLAFHWSAPPVTLDITGPGALGALLLTLWNRRRYAKIQADADRLVQTAREML